MGSDEGTRVAADMFPYQFVEGSVGTLPRRASACDAGDNFVMYALIEAGRRSRPDFMTAGLRILQSI